MANSKRRRPENDRTPTTKEYKRCGAKKKNGDLCRLPAGYGTDHYGFGKCHHHLGCVDQVAIAAYREEAAEMVAEWKANPMRANQPIAVDPGDALIQEVHRTAGVVQWLEDLIAEMEGANDLTTLTQWGTKPRAFMDVYFREREHLAKVAKLTLDAGVAERHVKLAEEQGRLVAMVINKVLGDLGLDDDQKGRAPGIVRTRLMELNRPAA